MSQWPKFTKTRFEPLGLSQCGPRLWRWVDTSWKPEAPAVVGPHYQTKMEALADLERYARESWGIAT